MNETLKATEAQLIITGDQYFFVKQFLEQLYSKLIFIEIP